MTKKIFPSQFDNRSKESVTPMGFDFTARLDSGETISTATFSISSFDGSDSNVSSMLSGEAIIGPTIDGELYSNVVAIVVKNGISGKTYTLSCTITTSADRTITGSKQFTVE